MRRIAKLHSLFDFLISICNHMIIDNKQLLIDILSYVSMLGLRRLFFNIFYF